MTARHTTRGPRGARLAWTAALALALALLPAPVRGDDGPPSEPPPAGDVGSPPPAPAGPAAPVAPHATHADIPGSGGRVLRLDLVTAARMGREANLRIQAGAFDPRIAGDAVISEWGAFDVLLTSSMELSHTETPSTSAFFGKPVVSDEGFRLEAGASKRLLSGGTASFLYRADRLSTDSLFVTLDPSWTQSATLEVSHPLLRGAGDVAIADIRRATNDAQRADANQRALVEDVLAEVAAAYWHLVFSQENLVSRRKSEEVALELLHDEEARLEARVGTPLDVADARAGYEQRVGDRILAEGELQAAQDGLRRLILPFAPDAATGVTIVATDDPRTYEGLAVDETADLERYVQLALASREELRASEADLANRRIDVYVAANAVKPQLDAFGRVSTAGLDGGFGGALGDAATGEAFSAAVGVSFSLFVGQRTAKANLRIAEWARRQTAIRILDLKNQIIAEVRAGLRDVATARAVESAAIAEVTAAQEGLDGERDRLAQGKSTPFRVLQKESDLTDARTRRARAGTELRAARARFWRSLGLLAEQLGIPR